MVNIAIIEQLLQMSRSAGQIPTEIHFSQRTLDEVKAIARQQAARQPDARSILMRVFRAQPEPQNEQLLLCGLPTFANPDCDDDCVAIRTASAMDDPRWLAKLKDNKPQHEAIAETPWFERREVAEESDRVGAASLIKPSTRPSPTDVLIHSMEEADGMMDVIVVKIANNGDVFMSSSMPKLAAAGYIQKVLSKLMFE